MAARKARSTVQRLGAVEAAERMMAARGYVVIGLHAGGPSLAAGSTVRDFAQVTLPTGMCLEVRSETNRSDWEAQILALFGSAAPDKNPVELGQRFYRCALVRREQLSHADPS